MLGLRRLWAATGAVSGAVIAHCSLASCDTSLPREPSTAEVLQGEYENRLRNHANPEKLFEYFASVPADEDTGETLMVPSDLIRALVPYNRALGGRVGSPNPKYRYAARKERSTPAARARYTALVATAMGQQDTTSEEIKRKSAIELLSMRAARTADNSTHLHAIRAAKCTHGQFTETLCRLLHRHTPGEDLTPQSPQPGAEETAEPDTASLRELEAFRQWAEFALLADADGDGDIDFGEFITILTLLELSHDQILLAFRAFDADQSGMLDEEEAARLLRALGASGRIGSQVRDRDFTHSDLGRVRAATAAMIRRMRDASSSSSASASPSSSSAASSASSSWLSAAATPQAVLPRADPGRLSLAELVGFHDRLVAAVRRAEFAELDVDGSGCLSRAEFARLFASRVVPALAAVILERAEQRIGGVVGGATPSRDAVLRSGDTSRGADAAGSASLTPSSREGIAVDAMAAVDTPPPREGITVDEMAAVDTLLDRHQHLGLALRAASHAEGSAGGSGAISRAGLRRACRAVLQSASRVAGTSKRLELTPAQEDVIIALFDADGDGCVSAAELTTALNMAAAHGIGAARGKLPMLSALVRGPGCLAKAIAGHP